MLLNLGCWYDSWAFLLQGCDASVLLDDSFGNQSHSIERLAIPNKTLKVFNVNYICWKLIQVNGLHHSHEVEEEEQSVYMKHLSKRCRSIFCIHKFQINWTVRFGLQICLVSVINEEQITWEADSNWSTSALSSSAIYCYLLLYFVYWFSGLFEQLQIGRADFLFVFPSKFWWDRERIF